MDDFFQVTFLSLGVLSIVNAAFVTPWLNARRLDRIEWRLRNIEIKISQFDFCDDPDDPDGDEYEPTIEKSNVVAIGKAA